MSSRRRFPRAAGASRLGCLAQIIVAFGIAYFAINVVDEGLQYLRFRDAMKQEGRFAGLRRDAEIRTRLVALADSLGLPPEAQEVNIAREGNRIHIWSQYDQKLPLPFDIDRRVRLKPSIETTF